MKTLVQNKNSAFILIFLFSMLTSRKLFAQPSIGLQFYSLRTQFAKDVPGTLQKVEQMGFREIEMGGTYGMNIDSFKTLLKKHHLEVVSVGADFNELDSAPAIAVQSAKSFGAKWVVCFWIPHNNEFTIEDARKAIAVWNKAGKILKDSGLSLCYHAHGYEFRPYGNGTLFDYMAENLDPRYVNFEMDVFWIKHPGQDPVALLRKYPGRFPLMHLKDRKPGTPGNQNGEADVESNVVLGSGDVGIAEIMRAAKKAGVKHYFIEDESSRSEQQMPESLLFLKALK